MADSDQLERIRQKAYAIASEGGANADQARRILSKLPKVNVGHDFRAESGDRQAPIHGELTGGDIGAELPQTSDEAAGIHSDVAQMPLLQRAAMTPLIPSSRREFERGADDMLTFGLGQKIAGKASKLVGSPPETTRPTRATSVAWSALCPDGEPPDSWAVERSS